MKAFLAWSMLIVPWLSLFFLNKDSIKRYMPAAIFVALLVTLKSELAYTYQWWVFGTGFKLVPSLITDVSFVLATFLVGPIWILHFTYGNFWLYMLTNVVIDSTVFWVLTPYVFEPLGIYHLVNITPLQLLLLSELQAVLMYLYLLWQETIYEKKSEEEGTTTGNSKYGRWFKKEKAR